MKSKKKYTISTVLFDTREQAEKRMTGWLGSGEFKPGSMILEVTKKWIPKIRKRIELEKGEV